MNRIKDIKNREWDIIVNVPTLGRVRDELKMNLLEIVLPENELVEKLSDPVELAAVLYLLCRDQLVEKNIEASDFYAALDRDCLDIGLTAIMEGVVNFSPSGLRPAYRKVLEKAAKLQTMQSARLETLINSPDFEKMLDSAMEKALNLPDGLPSKTIGDASSLPELPESTLRAEATP